MRLASVQEGDHVVEIGPGLGSLTLALLEAGARVTAVEVDKHLIDPLREVLDGKNAQVIYGDALKVDWNAIVPSDERAVVVANLPYNVGTAITVRLLEEVPQVERIIVMLQKEVGERLVAQVGSKTYGALSVKVRYYAEPKMLGTVPPTVFIPKPEVDSAIVELRRLPQPAIDADSQKVFELVTAGFAQRRKMLRKALSGLATKEQLLAANIQPTQRAEELTIEDWGRLANCIS